MVVIDSDVVQMPCGEGGDGDECHRSHRTCPVYELLLVLLFSQGEGGRWWNDWGVGKCHCWY